MEADTPGKRVYLIRLALGDGLRTPMPMAEFAALLTQWSGVAYDSSRISKIENETRRVSLDDVPIIAAVDPLRRGRLWLGWGASPAEAADEAMEASTYDQAARYARGDLNSYPTRPAKAAEPPVKKVNGR